MTCLRKDNLWRRLRLFLLVCLLGCVTAKFIRLSGYIAYLAIAVYLAAQELNFTWWGVCGSRVRGAGWKGAWGYLPLHHINRGSPKRGSRRGSYKWAHVKVLKLLLELIALHKYHTSRTRFFWTKTASLLSSTRCAF